MERIRTYKSRPISIGNLKLGGSNPILLQSMTNTSTLDVSATVEQSKRIIDAGSDMVRITARNVNEAKHLEQIKDELSKSGYDNPIIADIHFNPKVAEVAAKIVEKIRINPGNYLDKDRSKSSYTAIEYKNELEKIKERLFPLIEICQKNRTAIRIGTNHGSLSNRILLKYGNTVQGMAESAMEFVRIFKDFNFDNLVLSMKSSDVRVMVYSTRMLVEMMQEEGFDYPLHLGVTEAGSELDGRIRSAAGIGTLLAQGIGDTIRVSLTENPENEIPVARNIVKIFKQLRVADPVKLKLQTDFPLSPQPICINNEHIKYPVIGKSYVNSETKADLLFEDGDIHDKDGMAFTKKIYFENIDPGNPFHLSQGIKKELADGVKKIAKLDLDNCDDDALIFAASVISPVLIDGFAEGIFLNAPGDTNKCVDAAFSLLQFLKLRTTKTEFISCPTCGRTQFDMLSVLREVKSKTSHLKGLKIAVMGCVVNGPGEMADADYGYVGSLPGKVNLYKSNTLITSNIDQDEAIYELINLIKKNGDWKEP